MDFILCRKCDTGNAGYLTVCSNCGADLYGEDNAPEAPPVGPEISEKTLRRNSLIAIVLSIATTIFKVWFLYSLETSAHLKFPQLRDLFIILWPFALALVLSFKARRWYWALFLDSIIMAIVAVIFVVILILATSKAF